MNEGNEENKNKQPLAEEKVVSVPLKVLTDMQEKMALLEKSVTDTEAKNAGIEAMLSENNKISGEPENKIRMKKDFSPKFRTVRIRKYPIAADPNNLGYVVGWTNRGAYQEVDRSGVSPQTVDMIDIIFLGQEKTADGKIKAEKVKLLDLLNKSSQVHCKILEQQREEVLVPTGEEIEVSVYDEKHGMQRTGETLDGFVMNSQIKYRISIPGVDGDVWIDGEFVN